MGFEEDCLRWREWARRSVDGSEAQKAAAGDAAAITGLLGGVDDGDAVAAAQAAAERFSTPDESADRVRDWISASLPIQTPIETWRRLFDSGWFAVPLHGLSFTIGRRSLERTFRRTDKMVRVALGTVKFGGLRKDSHLRVLAHSR